MPMFYTPKPRQFHYKPRFYDPEREDWELLKAKYNLDDAGNPKSSGSAQTSNLEKDILAAPQADSQHLQEEEAAALPNKDIQGIDDKDLEYFQRRLRDIDRKERQEKQKITLADLFRKRERPQFHYVSRFDENGNLIDNPSTSTKGNAVKRHITRRFNDEDMDGLKPVPAGKIMIYTLLVCVLLYLIFA